MAKTYKAEYVFSARDETSQTIAKIKDEMKSLYAQLNNVEIGSEAFDKLKTEIQQSEQVMAKAKEGIGMYGKEQNNLGDVVRRMRSESFQQNYLFRQTQGVVGAAGVALSMFNSTMSDGSKQLKSFSNSLNQGYVTFQGLNFILEGIPGPWGLAISAAGGLAAAIFSMGKESEDAAEKIKKQKEEIENIFKTYNDWESKLKGNTEENKKVSEAEQTLLQRRVNTLRTYIGIQENGYISGKKYFDLMSLSSAEYTEAVIELKTAQSNSIEDNKKRLSELETKLQAVTSALMQTDAVANNTATGSMKALREQEKKIKDELDNLAESSSVYISKLKELDDKQAEIRVMEMNRADALKKLRGEQDLFTVSLQNMLSKAKITMPSMPKFGALEMPKFGALEMPKFGALEMPKFRAIEVPELPKQFEPPKMGALDLSALEPSMVRMREINTELDERFRLPKMWKILPLDPIDINAPAGSMMELEAKIKRSEEELTKLDMASPEFAAAKANLDRLKAKLKSSMEDPLEASKRKWKEVMQVGSQITNAITSISQASGEAELNSIQRRKNADIDRINTLLANENLSNDERNKLLAQKQAAENKYAEEEKKVKTNMWRADRDARLAMAVIDTASAVVEALPNVPLSILAGILGAVQIGIIASQSPPSYHKGGKVPGGTYLNESSNKEFPIMVRGGEVIRTEEQENIVRRMAETIEAIMKAPDIAGLSPRVYDELIPKYHSGGMVHSISAPAIISADRQRSDAPLVTHNNDNRNQATNIVNINVYGPISSKEAFKKIVEDGMKDLGVTDVNKYFSNQRRSVSLNN